MPYRLVEYNEKLAATLGWATNWEKPQLERTVYVSDIAIKHAQRLMGLEIRNLHLNQGTVQPVGAHLATHIDMGNWTKTLEVQPVKKPRRGKRQGMRYDWEWALGAWQRVWVD